ncbi:MAG: SMI1/KNR4 family protein [Polyangiaceae bacterium]|nr:SMI1/KNR4 family protein [Polyangiaceae bacterium]
MLPYEAQEAATRRANEARAKVKNWPGLCDAIEALGEARYEPAVPLLCRLWLECPLTTVHDVVGHALATIGTPSARQAVAALLDDAFSAAIAARVLFVDPLAALQRVEPYFAPERLCQPGGNEVPLAVLDAFAPGAFSEEAAEERWLELFVRVRNHPSLADAVRAALGRASSATAQRALAAARKPKTQASGDRLTRYRQGEHVTVWQELRACENIGGDLREEALAVAGETMARVAVGVDVVAERLAKRGWKALSGSLRTAPRSADAKILATVAKKTGAPLPPSILAFWQIVGGVDFIWNYKKEREPPSLGIELDLDTLDPLAIEAPKRVREQFADWEPRPDGADPDDESLFLLELAPDHFHKANASGGPAYGVRLPFLGADPIFANEKHQLPFTDYLRLCFRWGCFPGLERYADRADVREFARTMGAGVDPF